jgi:hypothetical protein
MSMHIKLLSLSVLAGLAACSSEPVRIVRDPALADAETFEVRGVESRSCRIPGVLGYELRQEGSVLATMDLVDEHRLYFARTLPPELRPAVAATMVVLMFFNRAD